MQVMAKDNIFKLGCPKLDFQKEKVKRNENQGPNNLSEMYVFVY